MEIKEFARTVETGMKEVLGDRYLTAVKEVLKNNNCLKYGIEIRNVKSNIAPVIYVDDFFEAYTRGIIGVEAATMKCLEIFKENKISSVDFGYMMDFNRIKNSISCKVINFEENSKLLEKLVYTRYLDLAIVYYVTVNNMPVDGSGSMMIKKEHLKSWGVKKSDIVKAAKENSLCDEVVMENIFDLVISLKDGIDCEMFWPEMRGEDGYVFVLSNKNRYYGAKFICEIDKLEKIAEKLGERYYILPSSIHELIVIKDTGIDDIDGLRRMVHEVNNTVMIRDEVLSDNVYVYDNNCKSVMIA